MVLSQVLLILFPQIFVCINSSCIINFNWSFSFNLFWIRRKLLQSNNSLYFSYCIFNCLRYGKCFALGTLGGLCDRLHIFNVKNEFFISYFFYFWIGTRVNTLDYSFKYLKFQMFLVQSSVLFSLKIMEQQGTFG